MKQRVAERAQPDGAHCAVACLQHDPALAHPGNPCVAPATPKPAALLLLHCSCGHAQGECALGIEPIACGSAPRNSAADLNAS